MHAPGRTIITATLFAIALAACTASEHDAPLRLDGVRLHGAGATFPYPVYTRWFSQVAERTGVRIDYRSIGSTAGIQALVADSVDFAATDVPLDSVERRRLAGRGITQVPLVVGGVAVTYRLPGVTQQLRLDGATLGEIFLGRITRWDDARLRRLNPDVAMPAESIRLITRADSSGTTWILTDYLTRVSDAWASGPGRSRYPTWPVGRQVRGNEGVAAEIAVTDYALGVIEAVYAMQNRLPAARIRNHAGAWVSPQVGGLRAAASAMLSSMDDTVEFAGSIGDAPGESSYPIAALSWLVIPSRDVAPSRALAMRYFVRWVLDSGDTDARALGYAPLPDAMRATLRRRWMLTPGDSATLRR